MDMLDDTGNNRKLPGNIHCEKKLQSKEQEQLYNKTLEEYKNGGFIIPSVLRRNKGVVARNQGTIPKARGAVAARGGSANMPLRFSSSNGGVCSGSGPPAAGGFRQPAAPPPTAAGKRKRMIGTAATEKGMPRTAGNAFASSSAPSNSVGLPPSKKRKLLTKPAEVETGDGGGGGGARYQREREPRSHKVVVSMRNCIIPRSISLTEDQMRGLLVAGQKSRIKAFLAINSAFLVHSGLVKEGCLHVEPYNRSGRHTRAEIDSKLNLMRHRPDLVPSLRMMVDTLTMFEEEKRLTAEFKGTNPNVAPLNPAEESDPIIAGQLTANTGSNAIFPPSQPALNQLSPGQPTANTGSNVSGAVMGYWSPMQVDPMSGQVYPDEHSMPVPAGLILGNDIDKLLWDNEDGIFNL